MSRYASLPANLLTVVAVAVVLAVAAACGGSTASPGPGRPSGGSSEGASAGSGGALSSYVALGDSYSAAPGNPVTSAAGGCERSDHDYPHLLAQRLGIADLADVTCSGAQTKDFAGRQQPYGGSGPVAPQLDAVTPSTDLVTVSIGGNDLNLIGLLYECGTMAAQGSGGQGSSGQGTGSPCADRYSKQVEGAVPEVQQRVTEAVRAVRRKAPRARVVVVGYPQPFPTSGTCPALPLAPGDYAFAATIMDRLNTILSTAAGATGATYVDVSGPSRGHDICSSSPWINGAQAAGDAQPIHPFPREQTAVAGLIADALR